MTHAEAAVRLSTRSPFVGTWQENHLIRPGNHRKVTFTNLSPNDAVVDKSGFPIELKAGEVLTIPVDSSSELLIQVPSGKEAAGFFVLHDTLFDWRISSPGEEVSVAHSDPISLALVVGPKSDFAVDWIADQAVLLRLGPGEADSRHFNEQEARTSVLRAKVAPEPPAGTQAVGVICGMDPEDE